MNIILVHVAGVERNRSKSLIIKPSAVFIHRHIDIGGDSMGIIALWQVSVVS